MDGDGVARLSEYGLEAVLRDEAPSKLIPANPQWMAPEILRTKGERVRSGDGGKAADIYSFAMVMFEVCLLYLYPHIQVCISASNPWPQILTGTNPFPYTTDEEIVDKIVGGLRPERPSDNPPDGMADELWEQITACWNQEPNERPTALEVLRALGSSRNREPPVLMEETDAEMMRELDRVEGDPEESTVSVGFDDLRSNIWLAGIQRLRRLRSAESVTTTAANPAAFPPCCSIAKVARTEAMDPVVALARKLGNTYAESSTCRDVYRRRQRRR